MAEASGESLSLPRGQPPKYLSTVIVRTRGAGTKVIYLGVVSG